MSKRSFFVSMLSGAICFLNIFVYALLYRKSGNEDIGWMLWSFSHYFTFSIALCSFVKITKSLIKQAKAVGVFGLILLIIGFFSGYYISVLKEDTIKFFIFCVIEIAVGVTFIILEIFIYRKGIFNKKIRGRTKTIEQNNEDVYLDYLSYFMKEPNDQEFHSRISINFALFFSAFVYVGFIFFIIIANVVCKDIKWWHVLMVIVLALISLLFNYFKLIKYAPKNSKRFILEEASLLLSFIVYLVVEWWLLPVTFNILLVTFCSTLITPIHLTQIRLSKIYRQHYKNK